jgi:potassium-transporting ATPase potassium-binding subunit
MARVYMGQPSGLDRVLGPLERLIYRLCGVCAVEEMGWKTYAIAMLLFNLFGFLAVTPCSGSRACCPSTRRVLGR